MLPFLLGMWIEHLICLGERVTGAPLPPPPSAPASAPPLTELPLPAAPDLPGISPCLCVLCYEELIDSLCPGESATDAPPPPTPRSALPSTDHAVPTSPGLTPSIPPTRQESLTYSPAPPSPPPAPRVNHFLQSGDMPFNV